MRSVLFICVSFFAVADCTAIRPLTVAESPPIIRAMFSHAPFERVVQGFVDEHGWVDYAALKDDPHDLEQHYFQLASSSPDSHPELFPTQQDKLAYWINAYNAAVLKTVLTHYPITSVADVKPPFPFFFLPRKSGFFLFQRPTFGGTKMSLYYLEHYLIRKRFAEPRIHFALNCASVSYPRLPMRAFTAEQLETQLDQEARRFVAEARNLSIDHQRKTVWLSSIFDWYQEDFLHSYRQQFPHQKATLLNYVVMYTSPEQIQELKRAASYTTRFTAYDWSLNDQKLQHQQ